MMTELNNKIEELKTKKEKLRGEFSEYELPKHLEIYIEIKSIDYAIQVL